MAIHQIENKYLRRAALVLAYVGSFVFCMGAGLVQGLVDGYWVFTEEITPIIKSVW